MRSVQTLLFCHISIEAEKSDLTVNARLYNTTVRHKLTGNLTAGENISAPHTREIQRQSGECELSPRPPFDQHFEYKIKKTMI